MKKNSRIVNDKTERLVGLGIMTAVVIVLQVIATFIHFGPFSITLTMVPIIVGTAMYGIGAGAYLGAVFGAIVVIMCLTGGDGGGAMLWNANPIACLLLCMLKGTLAGLEAGIHYRALERTNKVLACVTAALTAPVVNTGIFLLGMVLFFKDTLLIWAGDTNVLYYIIFGIVGVNFLIELGLNMVLSPAVVRIIQIVKNRVN